MDAVTLVVLLGLAGLTLLATRLYTVVLPEVPWAGLDREAVQRAERLVRTVLSEAERKQLKRCGYLEVSSQVQEGRLYRIPARPGLVEQVEPDGRRRLLCLVPLVSLPAPEVLLVHKLWIEGDEEQYLRMANRMPLWADMTNWGGRRAP